MRTQSIDTPADVEEILVGRLREMSVTERLQRTFELTAAARSIAAERIRETYGLAPGDREITLRLAALSLDRATMIAVFGWDPELRGY